MPVPTTAEENANQGTADWVIANASVDAIEGYASPVSVAPGGQISLHVSTAAPLFSMEIFRMGWYQGFGARLMATVDNLVGDLQAPPTEDPRGMIECAWRASHVLDVPLDWCPGVYLVKLRTKDHPVPAPNGGGFQRYVIFIVTDDHRRPMLFQTSVTTYQAYNDWGGNSLYGDTRLLPSPPLVPTRADVEVSFANRSRAVSFDRPYAKNDGAGDFLHWEFALVRWLEREGYDVSYCTNVDLHSDAHRVADHSIFLSVGHDEYWSYEMREHVEAALKTHTSLAFLGSNAMYWQVRFETSPAGPNRRMICYKDDPDPAAAVEPSRQTILWRDLNRPEQAVIGVMYEGWFRGDQVPNAFPLRVVNTHLWPFRDSGLVDGQKIPRLVGYEYDKVFSGVPTPSHLVILAESPVVADGGLASVSNATLYTAPSGAMVFAAGTNDWAYGLLQGADNHFVAHPAIETITRNVLDRFAALSGGRVLVADFLQGPPVRGLYWENHRAYAELDGWHDPEDLQLVGDFMGLGRDQVLFVNRDPGRTGGRVLVADFLHGPPVRVPYWEDWGAHHELDGWHDPEDLQLVGDFMGLGRDQVLFVNRDPGRTGGRVLVADFLHGPPVRVPYWEDWGAHHELDGWHDPEDLQLVGDFMGLGRDQVLFVNRDPGRTGGRVLVADFLHGPPVRVPYWEDWGAHHELDGWHDPEDLQLVGDFMGLGRDQVLFVNRDPGRTGGRVLVADFLHGPPVRVPYWEDWGAHHELDGWHDPEDLQLVGDFMGLGRDQVLFVNRDPGRTGGRVLVADFLHGPPVRVPYWEDWGAHHELDGWHDPEDLQLVGDFMGLGRDQVLFVNR